MYICSNSVKTVLNNPQNPYNRFYKQNNRFVPYNQNK